MVLCQDFRLATEYYFFLIRNAARADIDFDACDLLPFLLREMVPRGGIEPPTLRFSIACSTN
jgi:hypothetical protein